MTTAKVEPAPHPSEGLNIYQIIDRISSEAGALAPASKGGVPFAFRGIDGTVAHLSPFLRKYGVVIVPTVVQKQVTSAPSGSKVVTTTDLITEFTFFAPDGSSFVTATTAGLANDYADRSTAQAQSVAFRVALLQTFALPTHSPEPEQTGVEPEPTKTAAPAAAKPKGPTVKELQQEVKAAWEGIHGEGDQGYSKLGAELFPDDRQWASNAASLTKLKEAIEKGETP